MKQPDIWWVALAASAFIATGVIGFAYFALVSEKSPSRIYISRYRKHLERDLRFLQIDVNPTKIVLCQIGLIALFFLYLFISSRWVLTPIAAIFATAPTLWLRSQCEKRVSRIEEQLDGWLLTLSNALKASASLGEAIASSAGLMHAPISQEIDLLIKENKLGTPLDRAMKSMSERVASRTVASALLTLSIARKTGGDLPKTLETAAASLREMARLEGVVRTKTAEGKAQTVVIAVIPFPLFACIHWMDPNLLRPLATTFTGHVIVAIAAALWLAAILVARKVLAVDI